MSEGGHSKRECRKILDSYGVLSNTPMVKIRGNVSLRYADRTTQKMYPKTSIGLEKAAIHDLEQMQADRLITIENEATYHTYEAQPGELVVLSGGFANSAAVSLIKKWMQLTGNRTFRHFGDIDGYGFAIALDLQRRTGAQVQLWQMDEEVFLKFRDNARPLTEGHEKLLRQFLNGGTFPESHRLFRRMLDTRLMLEQESIH